MISDELKTKVKEIFKGKCLNSNTIFQVLKKNPELKLQLEEQFNSKPKIYNSIGKLVILIVKDIELKKCIACGAELSYDKTVSGTSMFCSNKCKLKEGFNPLHNGIKHPHWEDFSDEKKKAIREKMKQTCLERYGVECYSLLNTYKKRKELFKDYVIPLFKEQEYTGSDKIYKWKCVKCGTEFEQQIYTTNFVKECNIMPRCPQCYPKEYFRSVKEQQLLQFIRTIYKGEIRINTRDIITPFQLDVALPSLKVAIEFNGSYWHSTKVRKDHKYHLNKLQMCLEKGYRLILIDESEWMIHQNIVKAKLKSIICKDIPSIYARNCQIKQIDAKQKNQFLNNNHIQGEDKSNVKLGLFNNNQLVAVMTFGKPRFNDNYEWELIRYATSKRVIGGAGKLLKYFKDKYNPKSIITYADRRYSNGNMYQKIGFKLKEATKPNYYWTNNDIILNRYQTQKHKLSSLLGDKFNPKLSEKENMLANNFYQVFDCGNLVYVLE